MGFYLTLEVPSKGYVGSEVTFKGRLTEDGKPVPGETVKILVMDENYNILDYDIATTNAQGYYSVKYVFTSPGTYLVKAIYERPTIPEWAKHAAEAAAVVATVGAAIYAVAKYAVAKKR
ncbi:FixH family protein [Candidatus Aerophobetes bacterium]|nr:FixH family protein [Candidatus Aerophobetes bacterium]